MNNKVSNEIKDFKGFTNVKLFLVLLFVGLFLAVPMVSAQVTQDDLLDGLVSYYKFDETSGTNAEDSHGSNDGTASNSRVFTSNTGASGIINSGLDLTLQDDVDVNYVELINNNFAISTWVNLVGSDTSTGDHEIIIGWGTSSPNRMAIVAKRADSNRRLAFWSDTTGWIESDVVLNRDEWYHLVFDIDSDNEVKFYVNNVLEDTVPITNIPQSLSTNIKIGATPYSSHSLRGYLDEFGVWNRALNSSEVETLFDIQKDGFSSGSYNFSALSETANFSLSARNSFDNSNISNFSVELVSNETLNYNTSNGTITTDLLQNDTRLWNITFTGSFYERTYENYNLSSNLQGVLDLARINVDATNIFGQSVTDFNYDVNNSGNYSSNATNPIINGEWLFTFNKAGWYSKNETSNITGTYPYTTSYTFNDVYDSVFTLSLENILDNSSIDNFTGTIYQYAEGYEFNFSTTNGSYSFNLLQGYEYFIQINPISGFATNFNNNLTFTSNASTQNDTLRLYTDNSIRFNIFDEANNQLITENITIIISGSPYEQTLYTNTGTLYEDNIPDGTYSIKFFNSNYTERTYLVTVSNKSTQELNAYLSNSTSTVTFTALDGSSNTVLNNVAITMYRVINNTWVAVESKLTDITGRAVFNYVANTNYQFIASRTSYQDKIFELDPILFDFYNVRLDKSFSSDVQLDYSNIYISFSPDKFLNDRQNNLSFLIQSPEGKLSSYYLNVTYPNGYQSFIGTNSIGEQFYYEFNITGASYNDVVRLEYGYTSSLGDNRSFVRVFVVGQPPSTTSWDSKIGETYGLGVLELGLITTFFALAIAGVGTIVGGAIVGGALGIITLIFFTFIGYIPLWSVLITILVGFMILLGRSQ